MNYTEGAVERTNEALGKLHHVLAGLHAEKAKHGKGYPVIAEGSVAEILKLRKEIDDMIGLTNYIAEFGVPPTNHEIDTAAPHALPSGPTTGGVSASEPHRTAT